MMKFNQLGQTPIKVSNICLGTMTFGEQNSETEAQEQLDFAFEHGINFIDTAEIYPIPPKEETYTKTESIIGNWLKKRGQRDRLVIATKIIGRTDNLTYIRNGQRGMTRKNIRSAIEGSLKRLQTDYIDLYQLHWPDRSTNFFGSHGFRENKDPADIPSIKETLTALKELQDEGKIKQFGISNETAWGLAQYITEGKRLNFLPSTIQNPYNFLNRSFEVGCSEFAIREKVGLLAYSPLAFGTLSGKYLDGSANSSSRLHKFNRFSRYSSKPAVDATKKYVNLAYDLKLNPAQLAIAYVISRKFVTSAIIGATSLAQLKENIDASNVCITEDIERQIDHIRTEFNDPCP